MKKWMALFLCLTLLLSGCGLGKDKNVETTATDAPAVTDQNKPSEAAEIQVETAAETEYCPDISTLVTDRVRETFTASSGEQYSFAIPQVLLQGEDPEDWNEDVFEYIDSMIKLGPSYDFGRFCGTDYEAWTAKGYLNVVVTVFGEDKEIWEQTAAVFRLKDGKKVDNDELLSDYAGAGAVPHQYQLLSKAVTRFYDETYGAQSGEPSFQKRKMNTLNSRNLFASQLLVDKDGGLSILARIYAPGKESTYAMIPYSDFAFAESDWKAPSEVADDLVKTYRKKEIKYTDNVGNSYDYTIAIPEILIDSPDAQLCNDYLKATLEPEANEALDAMKNGYSSMLSSINYQAWTWNHTLTVYVECLTVQGHSVYDAYTFDLDTGLLMDNRSVAEKLGMNWDDCLDKMEDTVEHEFERLFGAASDDAFKEMMEERNTWEKNLREMVLFPSQGGVPQLLTRVYSLAGAASYLYVLPLED